MKSQKIFKIIIYVFLVIVFFSGAVFLSAFFARFVVNVQNVDVTLAPLESSDTEFTVSFDPSFALDTGNESYHIAPFSHCNQFDENFECLESAPSLCPYLALEPTDGEDTEHSFNLNSFGEQATGFLNRPADETDTWNLSIKAPCFEGECPADYDESQSGAPLPPELKGATFKCDLFTETNDVPELVRNYLEQNIAYADDLINSIEVSATLTGEVAGCVTDCFSNVLFLPGMMGSRLYGNAENELWTSIFDSDHSELALDNQGKSIDSTIYTKDDTQKLEGDGDETGIVDEIFGLNIYKSFLGDLKDWKGDGTIADYAFVPYDWRLSLDDIITNGVASGDNISYNISQDFSESFLLKKLETLQSNSKSGKVTIIAHSNGGLVAKALVQKLKDTDNSLYDKIDKIIFVAVPQIGTPDAVAALLHGTELAYGFLMDKDRLRHLSENMPTVYNLLPSASYFNTVDPAFAVDKIVSFENTPFFNPQTSKYGVFVSNLTELKDYILGTDNRTKPDFSDTAQPNIGNSTLYQNAENVHQILDVWEPHPDTKVIQVAGWGEETIAGLDYKTYKDTTEHLSYTPRFVVDGDSTVVVPSALWMSESSNIERWWVNLKKFNKNNLPDRIHKNILEIFNLRDFIKSEITDSEFNDSDSIVVDNTSTLISTDARLHFILHSPLTLGITDTEGNYTGMDPATKEIKEEISDVTYKQIGEVQFISAPADTAYTLKLQGYAEGNFSLEIDEQQGNTITDSTLFEGIPSSASTLATVDITSTFEVSTAELKVDQNGDGTVDQTYPIVNVETSPADTTKNNASRSSANNKSEQPTFTAIIPEVQKNKQQEEKLAVAETIKNIFNNPPIEKQQEPETENLKDLEQINDIPLTASVADSGISDNWVWYGTISLGILVLLFLIRKSIRI